MTSFPRNVTGKSLIVCGSTGPDVCTCAPGSLAVNCTGLTQLNVSGCVGISGPGLAAVGECCPRLVHLDLSDCKQVTSFMAQPQS